MNTEAAAPASIPRTTPVTNSTSASQIANKRRGVSRTRRRSRGSVAGGGERSGFTRRLRKLVAEKDDAGAEAAGLDELQAQPGGGGCEHRLAAAQDDRVDVEPVFIDQPELGEAPRQLCAADAHITAGLRFQAVYLLGEVPPYQP